MNYRPEIDGLRAIAVLSVFLFHLDVEAFGGGFVGVDIFFVISGYLITSIIQKSLDSNRFSIKHFYERRFRRIMPALYVMLMVTSLAAWICLMPDEMKSYGKSLVSSLLFYSNFQFWRESGYFDLGSEMKPLLHTWSLSIEEQFYIFYPTLLYGIHRFCKSKKILIVAALCAISFAWNVPMAIQRTDAAFYFTPVRVWELLLGALLSFKAFPRINEKNFNEGLSWLSLGLFGYAIFTFSDQTQFPGFHAAIPCLGAVGLIYASESPRMPVVGKLLGTKWITSIGKLSYSLYLWHWPAIVLTKLYVRKLEGYHQVIIFCAVFVVSYFSWKFIEEPLRRSENSSVNNRKFFSTLSLATIGLVLFGVLAGYITSGFPQRLNEKALRYSKASKNRNPERRECLTKGLKRASSEDLCPLGVKKNGQTPIFLMWGDSHADALMPAFQLMAHKNGVFGEFSGLSACTPLLGVTRFLRQSPEDCKQTNEKTMAYIEKKSVKNVVLVSRWATNGVQLDGETGRPSKNDIRVFAAGLDQLLDRLHKSGTKIWVVKKIPIANFNIPFRLARLEMLGQDSSKLHIDYDDYVKYVTPFNQVLDEMMKKYDIHIIDLAESLCSEKSKTCKVQIDGHPLYADHHHLTRFGAEYLAPELQPLFDGFAH